nr:extracellular solute-binding protein [Brucella intermedia]
MGTYILASAVILLPMNFETKAQAATADTAYAISMYGDIALPSDFTHFPYADPNAPKGGNINYGVVGTFDSLNPFVLQSMRTVAGGIYADGTTGNLVFETLMQRSQDEPFTLYPLLAEKVRTDEQRSFIEFTLNPKAKWSDGQPVTPDDVIFTYDILAKKGRPPYSNRVKRIKKIEKIGERGIRFTFNDTSDREFALIIAGSMPVLPKHAIDPDAFGKATLTPPVGSGPYLIERVDPGNLITFHRNSNYWGDNLPSRRGFNNFEKININYFRNETSLFEAFKKGLIDVFIDYEPTHWAKDYNFPAAVQGQVVRETFKKSTPPPMLGFVFNTRRQIFADEKVRRALSALFDFEWTNRELFAGQYQRLDSFWQNTPLSGIGVAASPRERALLAPYPGSVLPGVLNGTWFPTQTDGSGRDRRSMREALDLLLQAGYTFRDGVTYDPNKKRLHFEIMTQTLEQEKISLVYQRSLARLGIEVVVRTVDDAQYQQRLQNFDYDMIVGTLSASLSPGNEQWMRWGTASRDIQGSFNYAGADDPAIDALINDMLKQTNRSDFTESVRALDRVLVSGSYYIPLYYLPEQRVAYWSRLGHPKKISLYGVQFSTWWNASK